MSHEKLTPQSPESLSGNEKATERMKELAEAFDDSLEKDSVSTDKEVEAARSQVEKHTQAESISSVTETKKPQSTIRTKVERSKVYNETLQTMRSRLKGRERSFSKVIHNNAVEKTSDAVNNTVGRSSSLLGGFVATFIGSLLYYYVAKRNGYVIDNYSFIIILFVLGAAIGLAIEFLVRLIKRNKY